MTIGATILQNYLSHHLPASFLSAFPGGSAIAYSVIAVLHTLPPEIAEPTRQAFAGGLSQLWLVMVGIGGLGLFSSIWMKHLPLHDATDKEWSLDESDGDEGAGDRATMSNV